jgi:hypothetical protein
MARRIQPETRFRQDVRAPARAIKGTGTELSYLIQKRDATRLHYDFRLELDGVLLEPGGDARGGLKGAIAASSPQ